MESKWKWQGWEASGGPDVWRRAARLLPDEVWGGMYLLQPPKGDIRWFFGTLDAEGVPPFPQSIPPQNDLNFPWGFDVEPDSPML